MAASRPLPAPRLRDAPQDEPEGWTLLDLVRAVAEVTDDDREIVAVVLHLLRSGAVRLTGSFRGTRF